MDDGLAECAIFGADNSAAPGSSGLNIQFRPKKIKGSQSEILKSLTNVFLLQYTSKCAIFQGSPGEFKITWSGPYLNPLYSSQSHVGVSQTNNNLFFLFFF